MALTNIQLINLALEQSGLDSSFQTKARTWLNHVSLKLAERQDYPKFNTQSNIPFVSGQRAYDLPATFLRSDSAYLYKNAEDQRGVDILLVSKYMFDKYRVSASGNPSIATIDEDNNQIIFNSIPNNALQGCRLRYFRKPVAIATDTTNDNDTPDFPDQDLLLQELQVMAYEFVGDPREQSKAQQAMATKRDFQKNMYNDDSFSQISLENTHFRPTSRRGRRGF